MTDHSLVAQLRERVVAALGNAPFDLLLLAGAENVGYVTGYRSLSETMRRDPTMLALLAPSGELHLVAPASDAGPVFHDELLPPARFVPYGRFYFESDQGAPASHVADVHRSVDDALTAALGRIGTVGTFGADRSALSITGVQALGSRVVDASIWMLECRSRKLPDEIDRLENAAQAVETAIDRSLELLRPGATELELANQIAGDIAAIGGSPRFIVVTSGERSALSDAAATRREIRKGDLVRFDIGCTLDAYWADLGRTVVVGPPDDMQRRRYDAIAAGEQAQLDAARPGLSGADLFEIAVQTVESNGLRPYRRHHCGHAIGTEVYERPLVAPGWDQPLEPGMTFCLETPFYELGWGGMMVEDMIVITEDGCRRLSHSDRSLRVR